MLSTHVRAPALRGNPLRRHALDARAQRAQAVVDPLIAAVDLADVGDLGGAVRAERGDEQGHARADVRAREALAVKTARAADDRAVRVADDHPSAHGDELVDEEQAVLEHLLVDQHQPLCLGGEREGDAGEVGGERGPGPVLDLGDGVAHVGLDPQLLAGRDDHVASLELNPAAEPLEGQPRHAQVLGDAVAYAYLAAGAGRERDEGADLDVVRPDGVVGAVQLLLAVDDHQVRADPLDAGAHLHQQPGQVLHVGLGRGVVDDRRARRQGGRHQGVLGRHHRGLVHEEVAGVQAVRGAQLVGAAGADLGPQRAEGVQVRIEPPAADHVAARRRHVRSAEAGEQRAREKEGGADALGPGGIDGGVRDLVALHRDRVLVAPLGLGAEPHEQLDHGLHVPDPRRVAEHDLVARQQRGCERRQGGVLVAGGHHRPREWGPALDDELLHARGRKRNEAHVLAGSGRRLDNLPRMSPTREEAWELVEEWVRSDSLRKHLLGVETGMRAYARKWGEDEELYAVTGLLHDLDYERYPDLETG